MARKKIPGDCSFGKCPDWENCGFRQSLAELASNGRPSEVVLKAAHQISKCRRIKLREYQQRQVIQTD